MLEKASLKYSDRVVSNQQAKISTTTSYTIGTVAINAAGDTNTIISSTPTTTSAQLQMDIKFNNKYDLTGNRVEETVSISEINSLLYSTDKVSISLNVVLVIIIVIYYYYYY